DRYLAIERVRFQDRLTVHMDIAPAVLEAAVPNLILQPIVENAIRHGISPRAAKGSISICARAAKDALFVSVPDNGVGLDGAPDSPSKGNGMGLSNVRARLAQLYGREHRFSIEDHPEGGAIVEIEIPLRNAFMEQADG